MENLGREGRLVRSVVGLDMTISMPNEPPTATVASIPRNQQQQKQHQQQSQGSNASVLRALTSPEQYVTIPWKALYPYLTQFEFQSLSDSPSSG